MKRVAAEHFNKIANTSNVFYEFSEVERKAFQKCLFEIYQDVATVCKKYNLCIMVSGGTALGAIRHQGFIPWDDDLDAMMSREDYNQLINIFDKELGEKYSLSAPESGKESNESFMEVIKKDTLMRRVNNNKNHRNGIRIDVFPIERAPSNKFIRKIVSFTADIIRIIIGCKNVFINKDPFYKQCLMGDTQMKIHYYARYMVGMFFSIIPRKFLCLQFNKFVSQFKGDKYVAIPMGSKYYSGEILPRDVFFPTKTAIFEGVEVDIPNDVDAYLKNLYGNYMRIPDVDEREQHWTVEFSLDTTKE